MRVCPVCGQKRVGFVALFAASVGSDSRCSACGSGLKFNRVRDVIAVLAFTAGLAIGIGLESVFAGVLIAVVTGLAMLLSPLQPDETDPVSFRRKLRNARSPEED